MENAIVEKDRSKQKLEKVYLELAKYLKIKKLESGELQFTDRTNKLLFLKVHGDSIRYCYNLKKFLVWNGTCWEFDNDGIVQQMVFSFSPKMFRGALFMEDEQIQIEFEKNILRLESYTRLVYLYNYLKSANEISITPSELDLHKYLFNAEKKTIDLKKGEAKEPEQNDLMTKKSLFVYDKNAKCPTWEKFLMQIFNNDMDLIYFVQKALGYTLSGDISEQCMFILFGSGANGKSTLLNVIQNLFGDYAVSTITDTFMKKNSEQTNDLARLKNARLVIASEAEENKPMSESLIKQITGGDKISARFLYGEYFDFTPTFKIFMATNHKPKISGGDNGIWRRIKLIPFTVSIPEEKRDKHLQEKLMEENAGILNWLLEGYRMWEKEGLQEPDAVREANNEYRFDMDIVQNFICDCLIIDATLKERILNAELFETFLKWCEKNNETAWTQRKFTSKMKEKNYVQFPSNGNRWWKGLSLKNEWKV
ncbi:phage/plasmid primase, P4 family [Treponema sp.]|uniref:DNA primase family protein n=1 Tax=Treponema sp. TaxID=166 RepID=UPI00388D9673